MIGQTNWHLCRLTWGWGGKDPRTTLIISPLRKEGVQIGVLSEAPPETSLEMKLCVPVMAGNGLKGTDEGRGKPAREAVWESSDRKAHLRGCPGSRQGSGTSILRHSPTLGQGLPPGKRGLQALPVLRPRGHASSDSRRESPGPAGVSSGVCRR